MATAFETFVNDELPNRIATQEASQTSGSFPRYTGVSKLTTERTAAEMRSDLNVADGANNYSHPNHSGDVTSVEDGEQTIAVEAVTYAKMVHLAADKLLGRGNGGGLGDHEAITLGTNLSMTGTTLNAAGGGGGDTYATINGDTGSATASGTDTLAILGGTMLDTVAAEDTPDSVTVNLSNIVSGTVIARAASGEGVPSAQNVVEGVALVDGTGLRLAFDTHLTEIASALLASDRFAVWDQSADNHKYVLASEIGRALKLDDLATPDDTTDLDVSTTEHGLVPKLDNNATHFLNGQGAWDTPAGTLIPGDTVVSETAFGQGSAAGSETDYSRKDHTHGTPTDPVTGHEATYNHANLHAESHTITSHSDVDDANGAQLETLTGGGDADSLHGHASLGSGDVTGPASSLDNQIARFNLTTGKVIQDSTPTINDSGVITVVGTAVAGERLCLVLGDASTDDEAVITLHGYLGNGKISYDSTLDAIKILDAALLVPSDVKTYFRNSATSIRSSTDGQLDIAATGKVSIPNLDLSDVSHAGTLPAANIGAETVSLAKIAADAKTYSYPFYIPYPMDEVEIPFAQVPKNATITRVGFKTEGGGSETCSVQIHIRPEGTPLSGGTAVFSSAESLGNTYETHTSGFNDDAVLAREWLTLEVTTSASIPTALIGAVEVEFD